MLKPEENDRYAIAKMTLEKFNSDVKHDRYLMVQGHPCEVRICPDPQSKVDYIVSGKDIITNEIFTDRLTQESARESPNVERIFVETFLVGEILKKIGNRKFEHSN